MIKKCFAALIMMIGFGFAVACAENAPAELEIFSDLKNSYGSKKEQAQEIEKIKHLEDVPALEWLQMSIGEKQDQVFASMYFLDQHGVKLRKAASYYYNLIQEKLNANPGLYNTGLNDVLSVVVYEKDLSAREALDKLKKKS